MRAAPLPPGLPLEFATRAAEAHGLSSSRLRAGDLDRPFRGARIRRDQARSPNPYEAAVQHELSLIHALGARLVEGQFICHRSAALLWGAPMPYRAVPDLHLGTLLPQRAPRVRNATGHGFEPHRVSLTERAGLPLTTPESTFATLGSLSLTSLVAIGDHLVRRYRAGYGRRNVGKPPYTTIELLAAAVEIGRWRGASKLRQALSLIREDSWSPRESNTRVTLVLGGLPEPELNVDVFDRDGFFVACPDMIYRRYKIAIEYQGEQHAESYAQDIERIERLAAENWHVIQVTNELGRRPYLLVARVAEKLRSRGWNGEAIESGRAAWQ